ncbi:gliding motility-associated C-terminal domain-containing protein [Chitinophaga sancti]|uniref:T9SS type B sorting domain-containing protein n=1 Tax=Chitinophaga sancti TaxID=1004 RepID=UPI003F792046
MSIPVFARIRVAHRHVHKARVLIRILYILTVNLCMFKIAGAQVIELSNPSMEGNIGRDSVPAGWIAASNTPDVLPGPLNIYKRPADGKAYAGLHSGPAYREGLAQLLSSPLEKGLAYAISVDLAYAPRYLQAACYGNLTIYGGNSPKDTAQRLWSSGPFTDTSWRRFYAILEPTASYKYISLWADPAEPCAASNIGTAVLIDNFSNIRQVIKTTLTATPSCNNASTGTVQVSPVDYHTTYTYLWTPGNYSTAKVDQLPPGEYTVVVTAANGATGAGTVVVGGSTLTTTMTTLPATCAGSHNAEIHVAVSGGMPPYRFVLDDNTPVKEGVFKELTEGRYQVYVRDAQVCTDTLTALLRDPEPLVLKQVEVKPCSCDDTRDGKLSLQIAGGTQPYKYHIENEAWQTDSILTSLKAGHYKFEVADTNGCSISGTANIASPFKRCLVVMPTAFSPNGDGNNDVFKPKLYDVLTRYELRVFNRWGGLVFSTNDPQAGWDGYIKGVIQDQQAFIYVCSFNDRNNERKELRGSVVLLR